MKNNTLHLPISGPQHKVVSSEILECYEELYNIITDNFSKEELSRFFPIMGNSYSDANSRIMLIGRSVNGWTKLTEKTSEDFSLSAARTMLDFGFSWLRNDGQGVETYNDENDEEKRYNINKSSFFRCTKKIVCKMNPDRSSWERWFENIVWSNLYTIAPLHSGNAEGKLQDIQLEISKKLLIK